ERLLAAPAFEGQHGAVDGAPHNELPLGSVPEASQQHHQAQVDVGAGLALAVAAEGDVQVFAQPGGQRNVPAAPEVGDAVGMVRRVEVADQLEAEHHAQPHGHDRIAVEVEEN